MLGTSDIADHYGSENNCSVNKQSGVGRCPLTKFSSLRCWLPQFPWTSWVMGLIIVPIINIRNDDTDSSA